jgi:molybdopterin-binding protein
MFSGSVINNVSFGLKARGIKDPVKPALDRFGLSGLAEKSAKQLSAGEMQRVSLARAMVLKPKLLLLDEPFANVDPESVSLLETVLRDINRKGTAIIMVSHILDQAYHFTSHVIRLDKGRVVSPELDNVFECNIVQENGLAEAQLSKDLHIVLTTDKLGKTRIAVSPTDIILSETKLQSSMQNTLHGKIVALKGVNGKIEVSVDAGQVFKAYITQKSVNEMGLTVGKQIYLSFKATAVKVF